MWCLFCTAGHNKENDNLKILHTADWHLGKKVEGKSMLPNQRAALQDIEEITAVEKPDLILVAGDVFDTAVPPAEAEKLFFDACERLSSYGCPVVVLAGNHDDEVRLCAARSLAVCHNIYLVGDMDNSFYSDYGAENGRGWIRLATPGGKACMAILPYPLESFSADLPEDAPDERKNSDDANENEAAGQKDDDMFDKKYTDRVQGLIAECEKGFLPGEANIFVAHIFMLPGFEEKTLGGAKILPSAILPENADFVALGHVHKNMRAAKDKEAWYSGSITPCNFGETEEKQVNLVEIKKDKNSGNSTVNVRHIPLKSVKKLIRIEVKSYDEAYEKLANCSDYAEILYDCPEPVTPAKMNALRALPAFVKFTPCFTAEGEEGEQKKKLMTDEQLFEAFFVRKKGESPDDEDRELFRRAVNKEELL